MVQPEKEVEPQKRLSPTKEVWTLGSSEGDPKECKGGPSGLGKVLKDTEEVYLNPGRFKRTKGRSKGVGGGPI